MKMRKENSIKVKALTSKVSSFDKTPSCWVESRLLEFHAMRLGFKTLGRWGIRRGRKF